MRLALACGRPDVDRFMAELSSRQLAEWDVFEKLEGGIGTRALWRAASLLAAMYAEAHRNPKKRAQSWRERDFWPWVEQDKLTPAAFRAKFNVKKPKGKS